MATNDCIQQFTKLDDRSINFRDFLLFVDDLGHIYDSVTFQNDKHIDTSPKGSHRPQPKDGANLSRGGYDDIYLLAHGRDTAHTATGASPQSGNTPPKVSKLPPYNSTMPNDVCRLNQLLIDLYLWIAAFIELEILLPQSTIGTCMCTTCIKHSASVPRSDYFNLLPTYLNSTAAGLPLPHITRLTDGPQPYQHLTPQRPMTQATAKSPNAPKNVAFGRRAIPSREISKNTLCESGNTAAYRDVVGRKNVSWGQQTDSNLHSLPLPPRPSTPTTLVCNCVTCRDTAASIHRRQQTGQHREPPHYPWYARGGGHVQWTRDPPRHKMDYDMRPIPPPRNYTHTTSALPKNRSTCKGRVAIDALQVRE